MKKYLVIYSVYGANYDLFPCETVDDVFKKIAEKDDQQTPIIIYEIAKTYRVEQKYVATGTV